MRTVGVVEETLDADIDEWPFLLIDLWQTSSLCDSDMAITESVVVRPRIHFGLAMFTDGKNAHSTDRVDQGE